MRSILASVMLILTLASCGTAGTSSARSPLSTDGASPTTSTVLGARPEEQFGPSGAPVSSVSPIGVGVSHVVVTDPSRATAPRPPLPGSSSRTLALTIRYPINEPASVRELSDIEPYGRWPLVVFAHGFDASADTYAPLLHAIAAAGFVVVTPEFPLASSSIHAPAVEGDEPAQARNVNCLVDRFVDSKAPAPFDQVISPGPAGVMGHSDGAQTVLLSGYAPAYIDRRIGAVVAVSGRYSAFGGQWFGLGAPPMLVLQASADELNSFTYGIELVQKDLHAAQLVAVDAVTHLGAVTDPAAVPPVANLVADTFAFRLRGDLAAQLRLSDDLGRPPLRLVASHEG